MKRDGSSAFGILLAACIAMLLAEFGWLHANQNLFSPNSLPWKPVLLDAPPNWLAHWQLTRLKDDRAMCRAALAAASRLDVTPLPDRGGRARCGFDNVLRADKSPVAFAPRVTATCSMQAALYWYQQQLAPLAQAHMGARLIRITQLGTFSCRNVNNEAEGRPSEHATANAIDIASFHFANGRTVSVLRDHGKSTDAGRFLDVARLKACTLFNGVLGPGYNRLHADHFHLDMGAYRICS